MHASVVRVCRLLAVLLAPVGAQCAPAHRHPAPARSADVVMLSDLHFDPFHDPGKVGELRRAPVAEWAAILDAPPTASQAADFDKLQSACGARGVDSPYALLRNSLRGAHVREPRPLFVTVSGDLLAHGFPCRFNALVPRATDEDLSAFSAKAIEFVALELRDTFAGTPIYVALGNNDSGCMDYRETPKSEFLRSVASSLAGDLRNPANRAALLSTFPQYGDYSVALPSPIRRGRLIVLQDIFAARTYRGCDGKGSTEAATEQVQWLRQQLEAARAAKEQVWVMLHIPPGVDVYTSFHKYLLAPGEACSVREPTLFLKSDALGTTIAEFSDVVRLAVFAHTHMDEIKLLSDERGGQAVPAKVVPSISPVNGNEPAFVVVEVSPQTATMKDYSVYVAADAQGTGWEREYRYSRAYKLPDFSAVSVGKLTGDLVADTTGEGETSRAYERYFFAGGGTFAALALQRLWPAYSCSLREMDATAFHRCMCPVGGPKTTAP